MVSVAAFDDTGSICREKATHASGTRERPYGVANRGAVRQPRTYVDEVNVVSLFEVVQHRSVVEVGERSHVLALLELWRVHLLQ